MLAGFSHAKATPPVSKSIVDEFNLAIGSSSFERPRWGWFPSNIAISDMLLKTRFFGLNFCRRKYPCQLSRRKNNYTKAFEIGVFWRGASLWTQISGRWGRRPQSIWIGEWCSYNYAAGSFHTKKLCSRLFSREVKFYWHKQRYRVFVPPFGGLRVNVYGSSMARWKVRGRLPISANWTFFASYHARLRRYEPILVEIVVLERGVVHFQRKF